MSKLLKVRKPKLRVTPKGVKITNPSARIGGKFGVNISKSGYSTSLRTKAGTINTGRKKWSGGRKTNPSVTTRGCLGCALPTSLALTLILLTLVAPQRPVNG